MIHTISQKKDLKRLSGMEEIRMTEKNLVNDVAIIGIGGAGTNIAFCFESMGYNTIHINSSTQDESAIKGAKKIRHLKGFNGCAGNRKLAEKALAENMDIVDEITNMKESIIYLVFSSSGGTGSGVAPALAEILLDESDKTVCCIVVLPDKTEDYDFHVNSYKCCQELFNIEGLGSTIFLDNNYGKKQTINSICTSMLNSFFTNNSVSELGNLDEQEKRTMIGTTGSFILSVLNAEKSNGAKVVEMLTTNNIFAPIQNDGKCEYIGIINSSNKGIRKEEIINIVGTPRRTFEGYGSDTTITIVAGLSFPFDHLNNIKKIAKEKYDERQKAIKSAPTMTLEDIDFDERIICTEPIKNNSQKKVSRREMLKKLQNS